MNFAAIFFWIGVGVSGLSEKSAYGMESSGVREEEERVVWRLTPICSFWCIWEKQNRTFQEEEMLDLALGTSFFSLLVVSIVFGFRLFLFSKFFG